MNLKEPVEREEFILLNQPAITIRGELSNGQYILFAQTILDGNVLELGVIGPSEEAITTFEPTFISMLQSLHSTKAS